MNTWFLCKAKYQKIDESGKEKMVSEEYLFDAMSFTEAESRVNNELKPFVNGEFFVAVIKIANFSEVIFSDTAERWFKTKVSFISIDEEKGIEKRSNTYILVQADDVKEAYDNVQLAFADSVTDYEIPSVQETGILEVFKYDVEREESQDSLVESAKKFSDEVLDKK